MRAGHSSQPQGVEQQAVPISQGVLWGSLRTLPSCYSVVTRMSLGVWNSNTDWLGPPWDHRQMKLGVSSAQPSPEEVHLGISHGRGQGLGKREACLREGPSSPSTCSPHGELGSPFQVKERRTSTWVPPRHVPLMLACHSQPEQGHTSPLQRRMLRLRAATILTHHHFLRI